jgi:hypothetical protein
LTGAVPNGDRPPELSEHIPEKFRTLLSACWSEKVFSFESAVMSFLRRDVILPLTDREMLLYVHYQRTTLAPSFTVRALFTALSDINTANAANIKLFERLTGINQRYVRAVKVGEESSRRSIHFPSTRRNAHTPDPPGQGKSLSPPSFSPPPLSLHPDRRPVSRTAIPLLPIAAHRHGFMAHSTISQGSTHPEEMPRRPGETTASVSTPALLRSPPELPSRVPCQPLRAQIAPSASTAWIPLLENSSISSHDILPGLHQEYAICAHLTSKYGGNIVELGKLKITGNSCRPCRESLLPYVVSYDWSNCWISENKPGSWILFDFLNMSIYVTRYSIKTYRLGKGFSHMKSWLLQGCVDGRWVDLDVRHDTNDLNGRYKTGVFELANPCFVTALRIAQTGPNHAGDDFMILTNVEFFGDVPDDVK